MISLTGGTPLQYMGAIVKIAKEKFARDTLVMIEGDVELLTFRENIDDIVDSLSFTDSLSLHLEDHLAWKDISSSWASLTETWGEI